MSIELNEHIRGIWYVSWGTADWMAGVWQNEDSQPEARYRFRYYKDQGPWDSKDEKHWYDIKPQTDAQVSMAELIATISKMAEFIETAQKGKKWELIRGNSTLEQFMTEFSKLPFVHLKELSSKDCRVSMKEHGTNVTVTMVHKVSGRRASATGSAARKSEVRTAALRKLAELLHGIPPS